MKLRISTSDDVFSRFSVKKTFFTFLLCSHTNLETSDLCLFFSLFLSCVNFWSQQKTFYIFFRHPSWKLNLLQSIPNQMLQIDGKKLFLMEKTSFLKFYISYDTVCFKKWIDNLKKIRCWDNVKIVKIIILNNIFLIFRIKHTDAKQISKMFPNIYLPPETILSSLKNWFLQFIS